MGPNTLYLRLEGPLQAWGSHEAKMQVRRTADEPSKSAVIGLLCAALGLSRRDARDSLLTLSQLRMGVRIDRAGVRWWDYQTIGAGMKMPIAEAVGKTKAGPMLSRREYLADASFLVAMQGEPALIASLASALAEPRWALFLGRRSCPPTLPVLQRPPETHSSVLDALAHVPWQRRLRDEPVPTTLDVVEDWIPTSEEPEAPPHAELRYDVPLSFDPPHHNPRFVVRHTLPLAPNGDVPVDPDAAVRPTPRPLRPRANYTDTAYRAVRAERLAYDRGLCVFCKDAAPTVQHITYRRGGGKETLEDLKSLCRLCHDAVTMLEYGAHMGLDRIDPEDPAWRDRIIAQRRDIIAFRSLESRRRRLSSVEV
ncbi:MAG: type I-E CRISPR-associated protein Cas5/CasD [Chthonomonadales bacterium]|nr:type I-E CRISPR-associated protein Cas5/CasD [Chthonomonadales bacterium]